MDQTGRFTWENEVLMFQTMRSTKTNIPNLNQKMYPFSKSPPGFSHQQEGLYDLVWSYMILYASICILLIWKSYHMLSPLLPFMDAMSAPWKPSKKDRHLDTFFRLIRSSVVLSSFSCICCKVLDTSSIQPWFKGKGISWQIHGVIEPKYSGIQPAKFGLKRA